MTDTMATPEMPMDEAAPMEQAPMDQAPTETPDLPAPEGGQAPPSAPQMGAETPEMGQEQMPEPGPEATIGEPPKGNEIQKLADAYVIPISDEALKKWEKAGPEEFKKYAEQVAMGMYPTFAPQIQAGMTVDVLLDPYIEVAKQTLGSQMGEPNWSDPKWSAALQGSIDPKNGRRIPMSLDEWRQHLTTHPGHGWEFSSQAHEKAQQFSDIINKAFTSRGA